MSERTRWTPGAALAFIEARPGDNDADAMIRDLAADLAAAQERAETAEEAMEGSHARGYREGVKEERFRVLKRERALREALEAWPQDGSVHEPGCSIVCSDEADENVPCDCVTAVVLASLAALATSRQPEGEDA